MTTSVINATDFFVVINGSVVAHQKNVELSIEHAPRDITSKDSGGWRELLEGLKSWSGSFESLVAWDASFGFDDLFELYTSRSKFGVIFKVGKDTGDKKFSGSAYVTSSPISGDVEDNVSFSFSFEGTGPPTKVTIT